MPMFNDKPFVQNLTTASKPKGLVYLWNKTTFVTTERRWCNFLPCWIQKWTSRNRLKSTENGQKRSEMTEYGLKRLKNTFSEDKGELQKIDWKPSETTKDGLIWADNVKKHILRGQKWTSWNRMKTVRNGQKWLNMGWKRQKTHSQRSKLNFKKSTENGQKRSEMTEYGLFSNRKSHRWHSAHI